ncbi:MAG: aspartate aminotransferase family protein [Candidatus Bathyarchaeia archaeon]
MNSQDIVNITAKNTYGTWRLQKGWKPLHIVDAEGCYFLDVNGKRYLDFSSQLMCSNLGHKNKAVIEAICEQARKMPYVGPAFACDVRAQLTKELLQVMPKNLEKFFYSTSGTDAVEAALKISRLSSGRYKIISQYDSYHGSTSGSIATTGDFRRWSVEPAGKAGGVMFAPAPHCYRCPLGLRYPDCGIACVEYVDYMAKNEGNVAAVIVESVIGTNGVIIPPPEYTPRLKEICEKHDMLLVADEVMSGWGRTGEWFAVDHWKVKPDIIATAKGVTGAYIPLGVTATSRAVADYFEDHYFAHGHTYEAHPLTLAAGIAAVNEYKRLDLIAKAKSLGAYLGERLQQLKASHRSVGDVRGLGYFWAVELVKDRETKKPFNVGEDKLAGKPLTVERVAADSLTKGVYVVGWLSHLVIAPPLIAEKEQLDEGVNAIDESLKIADAESGS